MTTELIQRGVVGDSEGNFYGSTNGGGKLPGCPGGCGTIHKMNCRWTKRAWFISSKVARNGGHPSDRLLFNEKEGYFYGACPRGGDSFKPFGCIFKVGLDGTER